MANFKRRKPTKKCRCTLCTHYRWMGNKAQGTRVRDRKKLIDDAGIG